RAGASKAECLTTIFQGMQKTDPVTGLTVTAEQCSEVPPRATVLRIREANKSSSLCQQLIASAQQESNKVSETGTGLLAMMIAAKIVTYPIAIFVLFAGAILLFIRIISLAFILILGPIAFLFMILPKTQSHFNDWWDKLFKWSFFLPAFLFCFWLTFAIFSNISDSFVTIRAGNAQALDTFAALGAYLLAAAFMIGSLIVAEKMGVYGAKTVTGWGKNMAVNARGFAGDRVWKGAGKTTEAFMGTRMGQGLARMPLVRGIVRPAAAAVMRKGSAVEAKDASFYTRLPNARLSAILTTMGERQRQAVLGFLPMSRQRQFNADGTIRTAPTTVDLGQARNQAVQNQVMPVVDQAVRNLPEDVRAAVRSGVGEAIRSQPLDANPEAIANAISEAAVASARGVPSATSDRDIRFAFESGDTPAQMRGAIARGQRQAAAAAAPPQTANDWEERVERLEAQAIEQAERRPA
ncbi:MAG: type IV secretion system protein, partial [Candidatus Sungbacteria bacterium]|nr:type IV secretion system protein [Candidatus Sungbacteria bacterium]